MENIGLRTKISIIANNPGVFGPEASEKAFRELQKIDNGTSSLNPKDLRTEVSIIANNPGVFGPEASEEAFARLKEMDENEGEVSGL